MISENAIADWPKKSLVHLAARAARRLLPIVAKATEEYGPEALEWMAACAASLEVVERFANGEPITRFTLDLASEVARGTANSSSHVVRMIGPSKAAEDCELAFAAVAFTADAARTTVMPRVIAHVMTALRNVEASGYIPMVLVEGDVIEMNTPSPIWPNGAPNWWDDGWSKLQGTKSHPQLFVFDR